MCSSWMFQASTIILDFRGCSFRREGLPNLRNRDLKAFEERFRTAVSRHFLTELFMMLLNLSKLQFVSAFLFSKLQFVQQALLFSASCFRACCSEGSGGLETVQGLIKYFTILSFDSPFNTSLYIFRILR